MCKRMNCKAFSLQELIFQAVLSEKTQESWDMYEFLASLAVITILKRRETLKVLGIETSCDETGIAVYDSDSGLIGEGLYSQVQIHARFGGVIPELASRDHIRKTLPLIKQVLGESGLSKTDLGGIA